MLKELLVKTGSIKSFTACGFGLKSCSEGNPSPLHFQYTPIRGSINKLVSKETIQSLARKYGKNTIRL